MEARKHVDNDNEQHDTLNVTENLCTRNNHRQRKKICTIYKIVLWHQEQQQDHPSIQPRNTSQKEKVKKPKLRNSDDQQIRR